MAVTVSGRHAHYGSVVHHAPGFSYEEPDSPSPTCNRCIDGSLAACHNQLNLIICARNGEDSISFVHGGQVSERCKLS